MRLDCNNSQIFKLFSLYAIIIYGSIFSVPASLLAATMPSYEATAGVNTGPNAPTAIALDHWGHLYVVETGVDRIDIYDAHGTYVNRLNNLNTPLSIAISKRGRIYIGSSGNGSVTIYDRRTLKPLGKLGIGDGEFKKPSAIAIDSNGRVYVADAKKGVVKIYTQQGILDLVFGSDGINSGQFRHPVSIAVNEYAEEILVLDFGNGVTGRVQIFDLAGNFKRSFNPIGIKGLPLVRPIGLVMDNSYRLYISDAYSSQVAAYDSKGNYLGGVSAAEAPIHNPLGMAYEASLRKLYIASLNNSQIVAFDLFDQRHNRRPQTTTPSWSRNHRSVSTMSSGQTPKTLGCRNHSACRTIRKDVRSISNYSLQTVTEGHGKIKPAGKLQVAADSNVHFQITPDPGYRITGVKLDGKPIGILTEHTITHIRADHTLEVSFSAILEIGQIQADHTWKHIAFKTPFTNPVVITKPATYNDSDPAVIRIRNLDQTGFEVRLQEWGYLDQTHAKEKLSYLVIEQGTHKLSDDIQIEADYFDHATAHAYKPVTFKQTFNTKPIIVTSITSNNGADAVTGRMRNVSVEGFKYRLQEQELNRRHHTTHEQIAYIAWTPSAGELNGLLFEVASSNTPVNHRFQKLTFSSNFVQAPAFIADMQTTKGSDTANLRIQHAQPLNIELRVDEEQSKDREIQHAREHIGYLAFGIAQTEADADYDGDGLSNADEINIYGSAALAFDTDDDGLSDGKEQHFWAEAWSLDYDGDGLINLLDEDADNDGHLDGAEYSAGSDPANPFSIPR